MGCCLSIRPQLEPEAPVLNESEQAASISGPNAQCTDQEQETKEIPGHDQLGALPSSSFSVPATYANEDGETKDEEHGPGLGQADDIPSSINSTIHANGDGEVVYEEPGLTPDQPNELSYPSSTDPATPPDSNKEVGLEEKSGSGLSEPEGLLSCSDPTVDTTKSEEMDPIHGPAYSSDSAIHTNEDDEVVIMSIRATDIALGLRRLPAGFYAVVQYGDYEWRTENKRSFVSDGCIEWAGPIPIPSDLSTTVCLKVYASFEFQPVLGAGELLREFTVTVEQLFDCGANDSMLTFFPKDGDVMSPCSYILIAIRRQKLESSASSGLGVTNRHRLITESPGEVEDATNQGHSALSRYRKYGDKQDLKHCSEQFELALSICPVDHPCRAAAQSNLGMAKFIHCQVDTTDDFLEVPLRLYRSALAARPVSHPDRPSTLIQLAAVHFSRFEKRRDEVEAVCAGALLHEAIGLSPAESHETRAATFMLQFHATRGVSTVQTNGLSSMKEHPASCSMDEARWLLSVQLLDRFERFGELADLQRAITILEEVIRSTPVWDDRYREGLAHLGVTLQHRFNHLGELNDLTNAISRYKDAVNLTPRGHPDEPARLNNLGSSFKARFEHTGKLSDLEDAISTLKNAVDITADGHPQQPGRLNNLGNALLRRFERLGELSDLEDAVSRYRNAVDLTPDSHPLKPGRLNSLGNSLRARFERLGELNDLEDAISTLMDAVNLTPHDHPHKPALLNSLGSSFFTRFERLGALSDLEVAISKHKDAVDLTPPGHPHKPIVLNSLGNSLYVRFERLGERSDLEDAISTLRDAVNLTPCGHTNKPNLLNSLGSCFLLRFECLLELSDLDDAISRHKDAVGLTPRDDPHRHRHLSNLGKSLFARFQSLGELSDLEDAISRHRSAVDLTPHGHPHRPGHLSDLGNSLKARFEHLRELSDLEDAVLTLKDSVRTTPHGHPDKPGRLSNLGNTFITRFRRLGELNNLEQAISSLRDAVELSPCGHPNEPAYLSHLGNSLFVRFEHLKEPNDLEQAISLYSQAASAPIGPIYVRFYASLDWILCARPIHHHSILHAYSVTIGLLPQLAWTGLSLADRYSALMRGAGVVCEAAAAALDSGLPETAVEWLEQGRSIVWGELFQLRSSYEVLSSAHPNHGQRLQELSVELERAGAAREKSLFTLSEPTPSGTYRTIETLHQQADRHRKLAIERDKLLQEIRCLPGFERFLLHKDFSQLRASAHSGPVVILNAAERRCDALIVLADVDHVIHVPLPNFTLKRTANLQNTLKGFLRHIREGKSVPWDGVTWESFLSPLWKCVVKPVLDTLGFSTPGELSRIFWCPTGPFMFLPIHAAGFYDEKCSPPGHKVYDFVVSSYVPTLSILTLSPNPGAPSTRNLRLLAVPQPPSDSQPRLPGVAIELKHIQDVIRNSPSARTTLLESSAGTVEEVLDMMKEADWVHFACHGIQDIAFPTDSGLCLADGRRLKLRDMVALSRPHGGLAFLSACQTAKGDERLSDEAVHIAAGMLFAGYGGVVGTMWSISDKLAPDVARDVYEYLFRNGTRPDYWEAARALHEAIASLRESGASFGEWIPFIHVGF